MPRTLAAPCGCWGGRWRVTAAYVAWDREHAIFIFIIFLLKQLRVATMGVLPKNVASWLLGFAACGVYHFNLFPGRQRLHLGFFLLQVFNFQPIHCCLAALPPSFGLLLGTRLGWAQACARV